MGWRPKDMPIVRRSPGAELAARVGMRADQRPHRHQIRVIEDNPGVDTGQFDELPLFYGTGLLADGDAFNRTANQGQPAGPVGKGMAVAFPGRGGDAHGIQDARGIQDAFQDPMLGVVNEHAPCRLKLRSNTASMRFAATSRLPRQYARLLLNCRAL